MSNTQPEGSPRDFGLESGELRLVRVGPDWARRFAEERSRISGALGPAALDIQHVGSTAVLGIAAKPILDIAVAIQDFESGFALVPLLVSLGYQYRGENGIPRRHYFTRGNPVRTHHLHALEQDSPQWERHLRFRDRLLASPALAAQYSDLKLALASTCDGDRKQYQNLKSAFIVEAETA